MINKKKKEKKEGSRENKATHPRGEGVVAPGLP